MVGSHVLLGPYLNGQYKQNVGHVFNLDAREKGHYLLQIHSHTRTKLNKCDESRSSSVVLTVYGSNSEIYGQHIPKKKKEKKNEI